MNPLEKTIERAVCDHAAKKGCLAYKFNSMNRAAIPDRLFITPAGRVFFIEFKRRGQLPTVPQEREHARLRNQNVFVFVVDDVDFGKRVIDRLMG